MGNVPSHQSYSAETIDAFRNSFLTMQQLRAERLLGPIDWQDDDSCERHTTMNTINNSLMHAALQDVECSAPRKPRAKPYSNRVAFSVPNDGSPSPDRPSPSPAKTFKATFTTFFPRTRSCDSVEDALEDSKVALRKQQAAFKLKRAATYIQERIKSLSTVPTTVEVGNWTRMEVQQGWVEGY
ncbi:hypothetical protein GUITHDRAFT_99254 [Guillardia theta CCMP2712]|uniref:Uncharacterized protein n=1 Tax=Guillardia theta (strain CCMP2712) TaxID=905079 RepID=L1K4G4_GUITC|nr:hypothetical protein GUITHDRAFT_99254 [Guillardia theta CCMP2712]EKX55477.1 hypothetical protein GUITHDRAFT_99254 [Guillardia theta CCMP2712]|eukprot:XP_005842457.1 hypothetical protein GUITHDRAFT_99254 [Guillardia theta CCMP2712]